LSLKLDHLSCSTVFVYGTLKRGHGNNRLLSSSTFLTAAESVVHGQLKDLGGFPCWDMLSPVSDAPMAPVRGELWEVSLEDFRKLDMLEGHPSFFYRTQIDFSTTSLKIRCGRAWVYTLQHQTETLCPIVEGAYEWKH
jgi:gamma-glutamylaminecyclotransferase